MQIDPSAVVHATAIIEDGARIGPGCQIGPYAIIGPEVTLGRGVVVKPHGVVTGGTEVGDETVIYSCACVGEVPQDLKYRGEHTRLIVGARCRIREGATLNTGTEGGGGVTRVGDDCLLMTGAHVGHDASLGNRVILANQAAIAGHCQIGDDVIVGRGGADLILAGEGDDLICAGQGEDTVFGGAGRDILYGGPGADLLSGGDGDDRLFGEEGPDWLAGGAGNDGLFDLLVAKIGPEVDRHGGDQHLNSQHTQVIPAETAVLAEVKQPGNKATQPGRAGADQKQLNARYALLARQHQFGN